MADLDDLERQQREAYWRGEQEAASRLVPFQPQDPLAGAALMEAERLERERELRRGPVDEGVCCDGCLELLLQCLGGFYAVWLDSAAALCALA